MSREHNKEIDVIADRGCAGRGGVNIINQTLTQGPDALGLRGFFDNSGGESSDALSSGSGWAIHVCNRWGCLVKAS